jgi:hypothetical protein
MKNKIFFLLALGSTICANLGDLEVLCFKHFTDKGAWGHDYATQYEQYFEALRNKPVKLLEIGFYAGASAFVWDEYFPLGELHHWDIDKNCYQYTPKLSPRSKLHMVDQSNPDQMRQFMNEVGGNFDIIIDDGSHMVDHQIISFQTLFPYLKSGGIYVIEDLFSSYWKEYGGAGSRQNPVPSSGSTIVFLQGLLHDLNYIGARNAYANIAVCPKQIVDNLSYYQRNIKAMHFTTNLCVIIKR